MSAAGGITRESGEIRANQGAATLSAVGDIDVTGYLTADTDLSLDSSAGSISTSSEIRASYGGVTLNASGGSISVSGEIRANQGAATLSAVGDIDVDADLTAAVDLSLDSITGSIETGGDIVAGGAGSFTAAGDVTLSGKIATGASGTFDGGLGSSGLSGGLTVTSESGNIGSYPSEIQVKSGDLTMTADTGSIDAGGYIYIDDGGAALSAGQGIYLGGLTLESYGTEGAITVTAMGGDVTSSYGSIRNYGSGGIALSAAAGITIDSGGVSSYGGATRLSAVGDIEIASGSLLGTAIDISSDGSLKTSGAAVISGDTLTTSSVTGVDIKTAVETLSFSNNAKEKFFN